MSQPVAPITSALATPIPRVFRPARTVPTDVVRPTRAEISLPNLRYNLHCLRARTQAEVWCVLKADGYGHGAKACARTLERAGADGICVALLEEGIELRNAGITVPIMVMGGYYGSAYCELLTNRLTPVIHELSQLEELAREVSYRGAERASVHVKFDTGMGRLGLMPGEARRLVSALKRLPQVRLDGLMTHFADADSNPDSIAAQMDVFDGVNAQLHADGVSARVRHAANTAAMLSDQRSHLELVRVGIGVFGVEPARGLAPELRPVMRVSSTVVALRQLEPGQSVGYGGKWRARERAKVATIPIGYADGLARVNSSQGDVLIHGQRAPIVGMVSMDMTTIDVSQIQNVKIGDEVVLLGQQTGALGAGEINARELADTQGTIPWEVLTSVSRRVPRFYRGA